MLEVSGTWQAQLEVDSLGALYGVEVIMDRNAFPARNDGVRPYCAIDAWTLSQTRNAGRITL